MTHPTDPLREALLDTAASLAAAIGLLEQGGKAAKKAAPSDKMFDQMLTDYRASLERARAALAAAPQPAPTPAADERAAMIEAIEAAVDGTELVDGEPWGSDTIAGALLADGWRKADPLADERERDAARAEGYRQGQENMRSRIASPLFLRPLVDEQSAGEWYEETLAADTQMYADAILAVPLAPEGSS